MATKKLKVINILGGPGTGKSTARAGLFNLMKTAGINCEEVTEYAKDLTWEQSLDKMADQLYILAKQNRKLERLKGKVEWVISDSPLLLSLHYAPLDYFPETFQNLVKELWGSYDNYNLFIKRSKPYNPVGRNQTEEEAKRIDLQIMDMLNKNNYNFIVVSGEKPHETIFNMLHQLRSI